MKKILFFFILVFLIPIIIQAETSNPGPIILISTDNNDSNFYAYDKNYTFGVNTVIADFNNDNKKEIITAPQAGGGPQVKIFNINGELINSGWFAFAQDFRGGVNLAAGDVNGDKFPELIVAQAGSGQAWVKIYNLKNLNQPKLISEFLAFPDFFEGGAYIAAGDINKDGKDEIIAGAGLGGGPQVRVFNEKGKDLGLSFFPFSEDYQGGVAVAAGDVDGDKTDEIVVGQAYAAETWVKVYESDAKKIISEFKAFPDGAFYGVTVSVSNVDNKKKQIILIGPGSGGGPQVKQFDQYGKNLGNKFVWDESFRGKTNYNCYQKYCLATLDALPIKKIITGPRVALTFDDGYNSSNGSLYKILNVLKEHNLQVTFFLLGDFIQKYPTEFQAIIAAGHEIGNHSYSHALFTIISEAQIKQELESSENLLKQYNIIAKPIFRYPYGGHNAYTDSIIAKLGYDYYQWTASTGDTGPNKSTQSSINGALYNLKDQGIILAHCQSDATAAGLDTIIHAIQNAGYSIVKISQLND